MLQNDSYLHHQSSVLFLLLKSAVMTLLWPCCFFKVCATYFLMWPPLWCNTASELKSIPLFFNKSFKSIQSKITLTIISWWSNLNLWLCKNYFYPQICITLFVCIFHFFPAGPRVLFGWENVCAAVTLEPLAYTRSSEFFLPYTRLSKFPNSPYFRVAVFQKL